MKKGIITVVILAVLGFAAYKIWGGSGNKPAGEKQKPLTIAENTGAFNQSFQKLLQSYYAVKDALVASDDAKASTAALELVRAAEGLKLDEIQGDTSGAIKSTAQVDVGTIIGSAKALAGEKDLAAKRTEFKVIADALYSLFRIVKYSGQKIYWQYCPMAFNNQGANWVSSEKEIKNPYFGSEMLNCGEVVDSLDYSGR